MFRSFAQALPKNLSFAGHETFPFRYSWLKKAVDAVRDCPSIFAEDDAVVRLGVGKNMVRSMRHWSLATGLVEEDAMLAGNRGRHLKPTDLGIALLADDGLDPYLEDVATLWLIHWKLATLGERSTTWFYVFNGWHGLEFTKDKLQTSLLSLAAGSGQRLEVTSLRRDIDCFVRCYVGSSTSKGATPEDTFDCPLVELGLIAELDDRMTYRMHRGAHPTLPDALFIFALIDFWDGHPTGGKTLSFEEIAYSPLSPGVVFKLDEESIVRRLERLEQSTSRLLVYSESAGIRQVSRAADSIVPTKILTNYYRENTFHSEVR